MGIRAGWTTHFANVPNDVVAAHQDRLRQRLGRGHLFTDRRHLGGIAVHPPQAGQNVSEPLGQVAGCVKELRRSIDSPIKPLGHERSLGIG